MPVVTPFLGAYVDPDGDESLELDVYFNPVSEVFTAFCDDSLWHEWRFAEQIESLETDKGALAHWAVARARELGLLSDDA